MEVFVRVVTDEGWTGRSVTLSPPGHLRPGPSSVEEAWRPFLTLHEVLRWLRCTHWQVTLSTGSGLFQCSKPVREVH